MRVAPQGVERRLAAIFSADIVGYTRLMSADERATVGFLAAHRALADRKIEQHGGRIANTAGDSIMAEFQSTVDAVQCAVAVQERLAADNTQVEPSRRLVFRIGIHVGEVLVRDGDLFGDPVNVAARLQGIAEPGCVCLSAAAHDQVHRLLPLAFQDLGPQTLKNVPDVVHAFQIRPDGAAPVSLSPVHRHHEFFLARRFAAICLKALEEVGRKEGIYAIDCPVLAAIVDAPGISVADLAERVGIEPEVARASAARLHQAGLFEGAPDGEEGLRTTALGLAVRMRVRQDVLVAQDTVLAPLTQDERRVLRDLLTRVLVAQHGSSR